MGNSSKLILPKSATERKQIVDGIEANVSQLEVDKLIEQRNVERVANEFIGSETSAYIRGILNQFKSKDMNFLRDINRALKSITDRPDGGEETLRTWFKDLIAKAR